MRRAPIEELECRGIVEQISNREGIARLLEQGGASFYVGYDPTARSLHVGHLLPILTMARLQRLGARPLVLVGGATGVVGDPSGRSSERTMLSAEELEANKRDISRQLALLLDFSGPQAAQMVDNADWIGAFSLLDWLRDVGKLFSVNYMISKESVRRRLEDREQGISYTEFSYMLLQAYDFLHLFQSFGCRIQAGGSDQWGNITAGIDLVRKVAGEEVFGLTLPLLTTSSGEKFGKSAGNAVWLDAALTTPYRFYQFWFNQEDDAVGRLLKLFTFLSLEEIDALARSHQEAPERRLAQRALAREVTAIVHGQDASARAVRASEALFSGSLHEIDPAEALEALADAPTAELPENLIAPGISLIDLLTTAKVVSSKAEARRLMAGGGLYLNNARVEAPRLVDLSDFGTLGIMLVRTGKRTYHLLRLRKPGGTLSS